MDNTLEVPLEDVADAVPIEAVGVTELAVVHGRSVELSSVPVLLGLLMDEEDGPSELKIAVDSLESDDDKDELSIEVLSSVWDEMGEEVTEAEVAAVEETSEMTNGSEVSEGLADEAETEDVLTVVNKDGMDDRTVSDGVDDGSVEGSVEGSVDVKLEREAVGDDGKVDEKVAGEVAGEVAEEVDGEFDVRDDDNKDVVEKDVKDDGKAEVNVDIEAVVDVERVLDVETVVLEVNDIEKIDEVNDVVDVVKLEVEELEDKDVETVVDSKIVVLLEAKEVEVERTELVLKLELPVELVKGITAVLEVKIGDDVLSTVVVEFAAGMVSAVDEEGSEVELGVELECPVEMEKDVDRVLLVGTEEIDSDVEVASVVEVVRHSVRL